MIVLSKRFSGVNDSGLTESHLDALPVGTKITNGLTVYEKFGHEVTQFWSKPWVWKIVDSSEIHTRSKGHISFSRPADWYEV